MRYVLSTYLLGVGGLERLGGLIDGEIAHLIVHIDKLDCGLT